MSTLSPFREDVEVASPMSQSAETWLGTAGPTPFATGAEAEEPPEAEADQFDFGPAEGELSHPLLSHFPVPAAVLEALSAGLSSGAVGLAVGAGFRDVNQLTNIVFYFRHPERIGTKIRPDERALAAEWIDIRDRIVKPALASPPASAPAPTPTPTSGGTLSSSMLVWPGASDDALAFMRLVYDVHAERSRSAGSSYVSNLPPGELAPIEGREAQKDAAKSMRDLLREARAKLAAEGLADRYRIGITSAYRPATRQFEIWQGRTFDGKSSGGGFPYYYAEAKAKRIVREGDYSREAAKKFVDYFAGYIASPGYSNHQDGLAFDLGTGQVGKGLGKIGWSSWFRKWLEANAERFHFYPLKTEAWHWTYHPPSGASSEAWTLPVSTGVSAGRLEVAPVPVLARHRGRAPDVILRWNDMPAVPEQIDVAVHLHGFWYPYLRLPRDIEPVSGLDLAATEGAAGQGRTQPTLTVLPRAHYTGVKQKFGSYYAYTFPALVTKDGLTELVRFSLDRFAAEVGGRAPRVGRLILTAHSGGGKALLDILRFHDPDQIHVFDALYWAPGPLVEWAKRHIAADRAAGGAAKGALRVFYQDRTKGGTRPFSLDLRAAIEPELAGGLERSYRIEASKYDHFQIPRRYGWRVLADASADVPDAYLEATTRHEAELETDEDAVSGEIDEPFEAEWDEEERGFDEAEEDPGLEAEELDEAYELVGTVVPGVRVSTAERMAAEYEDPATTTLEVEEWEDVELEEPPAKPLLGGGGDAKGKWVVLVAGYDYHRSGVDFEKLALNRMRLLITRHVAAQKKVKAPLAKVIETAPRFLLFDVESGVVRRSEATLPKGERTWTEVARFDPVTTANYTVLPGGRHLFDKDQFGRMSITDVYAWVRVIGKEEPGTLQELSFLSHGWIGGPILVNSDDGSSTSARDPDDKDGRAEKDFEAPNMDATALAEFRAAFAPDGFTWAWGCVFAASPHQVLARLVKNSKYRKAKLGPIADTETLKFEFQQEHVDKFFFIDPNFFPTADATGHVPLDFERTFAEVKDFFRGRLSETYCQAAAIGSQVACFGGLPGTYSDYEKGVSLPVMVVPAKVPPYSDNFTSYINFYTKYIGVTLDPEGRHYARYDP